MTTLVEFLTARLDEDAAVAAAATPGPWHATEPYPDAGSVEGPDVNVANESGHGDIGLADAVHIARYDPARVLADVAAKRAIIAAHLVAGEGNTSGEMRDFGYEEGLEEAMRLLALVYADHRDFDPAWRSIQVGVEEARRAFGMD